jgi:predicted unusual protein kinase regulating ubiquinone biosynthesis (AarF/ABC1/UbiB family)
LKTCFFIFSKFRFDNFSEKPIAAASMAQVHSAKLKSGEEVAVKVQYPSLERSLYADIKTLELLIRLTEYIFPKVHLSWLVREIQINVPFEMDFINEANNCERLQKNFQHRQDISTPKIYWSFTTHKVLTMEFVKGIKLSNIDELNKNHFDLKGISKTVSEVFAQQIFIDGFDLFKLKLDGFIVIPTK